MKIKGLFGGHWAQHLVEGQGLERNVMSVSLSPLEEGLLTMEPHNDWRSWGHVFLWEAIHEAINRTHELLRSYKTRSQEVHLKSGIRRKQTWVALGLTLMPVEDGPMLLVPQTMSLSPPLISVTFWWMVSLTLTASHPKPSETALLLQWFLWSHWRLFSSCTWYSTEGWVNKCLQVNSPLLGNES